MTVLTPFVAGEYQHGDDYVVENSREYSTYAFVKKQRTVEGVKLTFELFKNEQRKADVAHAIKEGNTASWKLTDGATGGFLWDATVWSQNRPASWDTFPEPEEREIARAVQTAKDAERLQNFGRAENYPSFGRDASRMMAQYPGDPTEEEMAARRSRMM